MVWLTWRQHRVELLVALGLLIGFAVGMSVLTAQMQDAYAAVVHVCASTPGPLCQAASMDANARFGALNTLIYGGLLVLPPLAGVFIGAPLLAREFEHGTARLVWTQGITRLRWLASKLVLILPFAALLSAVLAWVAIRWVESQLGMFTSRWASFDIQGQAFVAYVIFAMALGAAVGGIVRRLVPAMAVTLVGFVAIRVGVLLWVRPNFQPPLEWDIGKPMSGDIWTLGQRAVDLSGHPVSPEHYRQLEAYAVSQPFTADYLREHGVIVLQIFQPESRFWLFQNLEAVLFAVLALVLIGVAIWSTRRA